MMKFLRPAMIGMAVLGMAASLYAKSDAADGGYYTTSDKEFYLTSDEIFFIRPGLELEVIDVEIPEDMSPLVTYSMHDPGGLPLDINGVFTPGPVDMRFMLTYIPMGEEQKVRLTESTRDRDGVTEALGDGVYTYKFSTVLPDTYEPDATHTLGLVGRRDLREWDLDRYVDNVVHDFVPSGLYEPMPRDIVTTETCNGRCHDPLAMHGSRYREIGICTQCHNPGLVGRNDGLSKSFNVIIHQVHKELDHGFPTELNDCETCHTGGTPTAEFPVVATPNPALACNSRNRAMTTLNWAYDGGLEIRIGAEDGPLFGKSRAPGSKATGNWVKDGMEFFINDLDSGELLQTLKVNTTVLGCVGNAPGTFRGAPGAQHTNWMTRPSRVVCGACHDHINFETGEGHFVQTDDDGCGDCHAPDSGEEFDHSVRGAHKVVYKSAQLPGVNLEFIDIVNTGPGETPTVTFSLGSKFAPLNPKNMDRIRFTITGPNEDYSFYARETVGRNAVKVGPYWTYTFETPLPADAMGSYTVSVEGRDELDIETHHGPSEERDVIQASLMAFAVTDDVPVPRRTVVEDYNCESCHTNLDLHGGGRTNANYCNTCHRPEFIAVLEPAESVHFKFMIHKIHRGEDLENGYVVVRSRGTFDFSHVEFPGDLRNCAKCHVDGSYRLPLPGGLLATTTPQNFWSPTGPAAAACLGCHDSDDAAAHAYSNTTFFGEACSACHGEGMAFAVDKVHAR